MVQVVHYAMFDRVGESEFAVYARDHGRLITPIVAIPMLIEIASAFALCVDTPAGVTRLHAYVGFGLVIAIWLSTAFIQVPCHAKLGNGFDAATYNTLVMCNWIRTLLWSGRGALVGWMMWRILSR